jgi:hypothetical protein
MIEEPVAVEPRRIGHNQDRPVLQGFGADVTELALIEEYFEYRDTYNKPGMLPGDTLLRLAVEQKRRLARKAKGK